MKKVQFTKYWVILLALAFSNQNFAQEYQHLYSLQNSTQLATANTKCEEQRMAIVGYYLPDRTGEEDPQGHTFVMKTEADGSKVWEKKYSFDNGDLYPTNIAYTDDEGFIISGIVYLNNTDSKGFLLKINEDGTQNWLKTYENYYSPNPIYNYTGSQALDHVEQDFGGNYITIGAAWGGIPYKLNLLIVDANGQVQKNKAFPYSDLPTDMKIKPLEDGNYLAIASFTEDSHVWLFDADLNIIWEKQISLQGNADYIWSRDLVILEGNRFVITGGSTIEKHMGGYNFHTYFGFLIQMDSGGNKTWEHSYRWYNNESDAMAMSIDKDAGGNLFVGGSVQYATHTGYDQSGYPTYSMNNQAFVLKTTESGYAQWVADYGKANIYENALDIIVHTPGEWAAIGHRGMGNYRTYIIKGRPDGDTPCDMNMHYPVDSTLNYQISNVNTNSVFPMAAMIDHQDLSQGFTNIGNDCNGQTVQLRATPEDFLLKVDPFVKLDTEKLAVFPNPSQGSFTVRLTEKTYDDVAELELYRIDGTLISKWSMQQRDQEIQGLSAGAYVIRVITEAESWTQKVVIR